MIDHQTLKPINLHNFLIDLPANKINLYSYTRKVEMSPEDCLISVLRSIEYYEHRIKYHQAVMLKRGGDQEWIESDKQFIQSYKKRLKERLVELELLTHAVDEKSLFFTVEVPNSEFVIVL